MLFRSRDRLLAPIKQRVLSQPTCSPVCEIVFVGLLAIEPDVRPATDSEKSASIQKRVAEQYRLGLRHRRVEYRSQK